MKTSTAATAVALGVLVFLVFAWWLTPYRYDVVYRGVVLARTHRITGRTEFLSVRRGWIPATEFEAGNDIR